MSETHSSPVNEKPNLDMLFPELKKQHQTDTQIGGPRFMAPATTAAALLGKSAREPARVPPPPSLRSRSVAAPPPAPSSRRAAPPPVPEPVVEEVFDEEESLATAPDASPKPLEPGDSAYVDDDDASIDDGPTVLRPSPFLGLPLSARPQIAPPSAAKLPPPPSFANSSAPSAGKLPPVPTPPSAARTSRPSSYPSLPKAMPVLEDEMETAAPPPVSMSAPVSRAGSAAALVASAATPSPRYVPPAPPPPSLPPPSRQETTHVSRHPSLAPTTASLPPPPYAAPARKSRAGLWVFGAAASIGLCAFGGFLVAKGGVKTLGLGSSGTGAVAVTAAGPSGGAINGVRVFVDGALACEGSPCKIADLSSGTHFVSVDAPGFSQTAARAISIERGGEAALHVDLVPQQGAPVAAPAPVKAEPTTAMPDKLEVIDTKHAQKSEPTQKIDKPAKADKAVKADAKAKTDAKKADKEPGAAAPAGDATLNINSIPVASVVLDGRPMGSTPLVGVHVAPGAHSVVFIHPEKGRKASGTTVKAGGTATVAVRF